MVNCLRQNFVYSDKRARDCVFAAMEQILAAAGELGEPIKLARLTREVAQRARQSAEQTGYEFNSWDITTKAVINSMLGAGVLLAENGTAVPLDIRAQATPIAALRPHYQDYAEAYLLECLIRNLGDVRIRDHKALAHALFRQFDPAVSLEELEDRVVMLLATLNDRVVLREDGTYAIARRAA
jgi:hypothetical protein